MANNIPITPGSGAFAATDQASGGEHVQLTKLAVSAGGDRTLVPATAANGSLVDVSRVQGNVQVVNPTGQDLRVDASLHTVTVIGTTVATAPVAAPVSVRLSNGAANIDTIPVSIAAAVPVTGNVGITGTPAVTISGTPNIGTIATITNPVTVTGGVAITGTPAVTGTVTGNQGTPAALASAWPHKVTDGTKLVGVTTDGPDNGLNVHVLNGGGGIAQQDKTAFTEGGTFVNPIGGVFNDAFAGDPAAGNASTVRITGKRALHVNIRKADGTELGIAATPIRTDPTGTTTQPVSGTVAAVQSGAWTENLTNIAGVAIVVAAAGVQKVGISDATGVAFSAANPLPTTPAPSTNFWKAGVSYSASLSDQTIFAPPGGKTAYIEGIIITPTAAGALLKIYDHTNASASMIYQGQPPLGSIVITPTRPIPCSAINNVLRWATGASATGDITAWGYYV